MTKFPGPSVTRKTHRGATTTLRRIRENEDNKSSFRKQLFSKTDSSRSSPSPTPVKCKECHKPKRTRLKYSAEEVEMLESLFLEDPMPNLAKREELAIILKRSARSVQIWFQNKRAKLKKASFQEETTQSNNTSNYHSEGTHSMDSEACSGNTVTNNNNNNNDNNNMTDRGEHQISNVENKTIKNPTSEDNMSMDNEEQSDVSKKEISLGKVQASHSSKTILQKQVTITHHPFTFPSAIPLLPVASFPTAVPSSDMSSVENKRSIPAPMEIGKTSPTTASAPISPSSNSSGTLASSFYRFPSKSEGLESKHKIVSPMRNSPQNQSGTNTAASDSQQSNQQKDSFYHHPVYGNCSMMNMDYRAKSYDKKLPSISSLSSNLKTESAYSRHAPSGSYYPPHTMSTKYGKPDMYYAVRPFSSNTSIPYHHRGSVCYDVAYSGRKTFQPPALPSHSPTHHSSVYTPVAHPQVYSPNSMYSSTPPHYYHCDYQETFSSQYATSMFPNERKLGDQSASQNLARKPNTFHSHPYPNIPCPSYHSAPSFLPNIRNISTRFALSQVIIGNWYTDKEDSIILAIDAHNRELYYDISVDNKRKRISIDFPDIRGIQIQEPSEHDNSRQARILLDLARPPRFSQLSRTQPVTGDLNLPSQEADYHCDDDDDDDGENNQDNWHTTDDFTKDMEASKISIHIIEMNRHTMSVLSKVLLPCLNVKPLSNMLKEKNSPYFSFVIEAERKLSLECLQSKLDQS